MKRMLCGIALMLGACSHGAGPDHLARTPDVRINEIQILGTHNSYSSGVDRRVLALLENRFGPSLARMHAGPPSAATALFRDEHPNPMTPAEMLNYSHPPLKDQLDLGVRSLEIDINPDPDGGNYRNPAAYRLLREQGVTDLLPHDTTDLDKPGFKVLHMVDVDFRSTCPTLRLCLSQIREWSDANPRHTPLFIMMEAKVQNLQILPNPTRSIPFTPELFDALDRELLDVMGRDRIITPDDVRGDFPTLNQAVLAHRWPRLEDARGKVLFLLMTANGPAGAADYLQGHAGLRGRVAFLRSDPGTDYAAFLLLDNALTRGAEIRDRVRQGYLVRSRSDIETFEAKTNDMTRAKAAFASGAQIVSTDFERAGNAYGTPFHVTLPNGGDMRCNPVNGAHCK